MAASERAVVAALTYTLTLTKHMTEFQCSACKTVSNIPGEPFDEGAISIVVCPACNKKRRCARR